MFLSVGLAIAAISELALTTFEVFILGRNKAALDLQASDRYICVGVQDMFQVYGLTTKYFGSIKTIWS